MLDFLSRWRTMRGHGVHSPYAFRFITEVLRTPGNFYADPRLESLALESGENVRWLKLLFRLVCEFQPRYVGADTLSQAERKAIAIADSRVTFGKPSPTRDPGQLLILDRAPQSFHAGHTIVRHMDTLSPLELTSRMPRGLLFHDGRMAVAVCSVHAPVQHFKVNFV